MGVNSLPKTVTRQHHGCDLNLGPSVPESSMLTTWLQSHPNGNHVAIVKRNDWRRGIVVSCVCRMNGVNPRRARLLLGWVMISGQVYHLGVQPAE